MRDGFIKVAAGTPEIRVADCAYNARQCIALIREAQGQSVKVLALPELCLTGYTCGDLFFQDTLLRGAEDALGQVLEAGQGRLRVSCGGLQLERGDLYLAAGLDCNWTEDAGGPELLRAGDTVALLSADGQTYYLIARMVRA